MPALTTSSGRAPVMSRWSKVTFPERVATRPLSVPSRVDLPAPLAPIRATSSPSAISRSTPKSTGPASKPAVSPSTWRRGSAFLLAGIALSQVGLDDPAVLEDGAWLTLGQHLAEMEDHGAVADADYHPHHVLDEDHRHS